MTQKKRPRRKRNKISKSEIRINIILISVIFGISLLLLFSKELFQKSSLKEIASSQTLISPSPPMLTPTEVEITEPVINPKIVEPKSTKPVPEKTVTEKTSSQPKKITPEKPLPEKPLPEKPLPQPKKTAPIKEPPLKTIIPVVAPIEKPVPQPKKGTIYFVFDDAGHNLKQLESFLALPFPCTIAVLPGLQYSKEAAQRIRAAGKELILHQPMQAINLAMDPGPGAIKDGMSEDQIRKIIERNLDEVGPVAGMNNHEGSLITADRKSMSVVLDIVQEKKIFFLDSRTNAETVVPALAREKNMTIWERAVFLDNLQEESAIIDAVYSGMKIAEKKGAAIMIGHIWSSELASILTSMYPTLSEQGFSLSTIAKIATLGDDGE
ncbi:MAG TPA: divergent polysaccharide deacetylase family protein [Treponemataceae bacterium]|nr:divergent polysaccharide deacetylase family protein [Treponemataceae bacterium]